jgi:hypothetical protein
MPARRKLPTALAKRAVATAEAAQMKSLAEARAVIAEIRRKQAQIADAFYDIGELLVRLKKPAAIRVLGRASFGEVCEKDLSMSTTRADWLVAVAQRVRRDDALAWGQDKTMALLELSNATTASDTPSMLEAEKLRAPGGKRFDLARASAAEIRRFAKALRTRRGKGSTRGRTTTPAERAIAKAIARALHHEGVEGTAVAVATKAGQVSKLRVEVPIDRLEVLRYALSAVAKHGR